MATTPKKPRKETAPKDETKADKFSRLASKRVTKAVKAISNIGNLSGGGYEYNAGQVETIRKYITDATAAAMERFASKGKAAVSEIKI